MLSITPIASASNATNYYLEDEQSLNIDDVELKKGEDNYYLKEKSNEPNTQWFGKLATEKGLQGKDIEPETLQSVLSGELQGEIIHGRRQSHKSGFDLTLSAPKSASILALVGGDKRLMEEHIKAVKYTLSQIEKDTAQVKKTNPITHKTEFENTGALLFGLVTHKTSRENEPAMHTHVLTPNMTRDSEGKLRALASCLKQSGSEINGTSERIYRDQKYYTALYQSSYAKAVQDLGYTTKSVGNGMFEINEVPESLSKSFSTRSQQIQDKIADLGVDSQKSRDYAAKNTRKEKSYNDDSKLTTEWRSKTAEQGVDLEKIITATYNKELNPNQKSESEAIKLASDSINKTVSHLSKTSSFLTYEKIITLAVSEFSKGEVANIEDVKNAIDNQIKDGSLIPLDENASKFTTKSMINKEQTLIESTKGNNRSLKIDVNPSALKDLKLDDANKQKITDLLSSNKQFNVVNLFGHSQQITKNLQHTATNSGSRVHFITPDSKSLRETKQDAKHQSFNPLQWVTNIFREESVSNINAFIKNKDSLYTPKDMWVVENANKLSVDQLQSITDKAKATKSKVVYLNHTSSRQGMNSNSAMNIYQKGNVNSVNWVNNKESKSQVTLHQAPNTETKSIAKQYASMGDTSKVQVLAHTRKDIKTLNSEIRQEMINVGKVSRLGVVIQSETPHFMSKEQREFVTNYKKGMVVKEWVDNGDKKELNTFILHSTNKKDNTITLTPTDSTGKIQSTTQNITIDPSTVESKSRELTFYTNQKIEISKGDKIKSNARHYSSKLSKDTEYTVQSADQSLVRLKGPDGKALSINTGKLHNAPINHNYAQSTYDISRDKEHLIVQTKSYAASKELLQDLTSTSKRVDIYTDKTEKLEDKLNKSEVRPSSIERAVLSQGNNNKWLSSSTESVLKQDLSVALSSIKDQHKPLSHVDSAVRFAMNHMSEKHAGFKHQDLVKAALKYALTQANSAVSPSEVVEALNKNPDLISSEYQDGTRWTTKEILQTEKDILTSFESGKNTKEPIATHQEAESFLSNHPDKTSGQKEAITLMATTPDRFVAIQGLSGTGKSTMLEAGIALMQEQHAKKGLGRLNVIGLAPTHAAVKELKDKNVEAQTLQSLLTNEKAGKLDHAKYKNALIILDESSMADNKQFSALTKFAEKVDASGVFLGDIKQLQSLGAGIPFQLGIERTIVSSSMNEILRQKNDVLKGAVHNAVDRQGYSLMDKLEKQESFSAYKPISTENNDNKKTNEVTDKSLNVVETNDIAKNVADEYLSRTLEARDNTLIVAYTNKERDDITRHLRVGLKAEGSISNDDVVMSRLRAVSSSREEMKTTMPYEKGLILSGIGNDYLHVKDVNKKAGIVTLINKETNVEKILIPSNQDHTFTTLWEEDTKKLSVGDNIVTRKTDQDKSIIANTQYKIKSVIDGNILAEDKDGKPLTLSTKDIKDSHWDYAYAKTANMAQGSTHSYVVGSIKGRGQLTDMRRAYIDTGRAMFHVKLFVDNKEQVLTQWATKNADNVSALDLIEKKTTNTEAIFNNNPVAQENDIYKDEDGKFSLKTMKSSLDERSQEYTESLAEKLLGDKDPDKSTADTLIFNRGENRISVSLKGQHRGYFKNWETNEKGSFVNLIMDKDNISFKEALFKLENLLDQPETNGLNVNKDNEILVNETQGKGSKLETMAISYSRQSTETKGTIAEKYLSNIGIKYENENLKFHPAVYSSEDQNTHPALIANITDKNGDIKAINITYLDESGDKSDLDINPRNLGSVSGNKTDIANDDSHRTTVVTTDMMNALSISAMNLNTDIVNVDNITNSTSTLSDLKEQILLLVTPDQNIDIDKVIDRIEKSNPNSDVKLVTELEIKESIDAISNVILPDPISEDLSNIAAVIDGHKLHQEDNISDKNMSAKEIYDEQSINEIVVAERENQEQEIKEIQLEKER